MSRAEDSDKAAPYETKWPFWLPVPLYPRGGERQTLRREVVQDTVWTFDQLQGIFYVIVPIRMTVIKLQTGGLFVYAPVALTAQCKKLVDELVEVHGDVKYVISATSNGIEHKNFVGAFAQAYPTAQVFVTPDQWSFPINLPLSFLGFPPLRTQRLPENPREAPFADEFDYAILGPIDLGPGPFEEAAFIHKPTRTLLVTDLLCSVPEEPPVICQLDPFPLLYHSKESADDVPEDSPKRRRRGWRRTTLFAFYFKPSVLSTPSLFDALADAMTSPDRSAKNLFGLYPFVWDADWKDSFDSLRNGGKVFVAPILQTLILNRAPRETLDFAYYQLGQWDFDKVIPCHFDAPVRATPRDVRAAFGFLESKQRLPVEDLETLAKIDRLITATRITPPAKVDVLS